MSVPSKPRSKRKALQTHLDFQVTNHKKPPTPHTVTRRATKTETDATQSDLFAFPLPPAPRHHLNAQDIRLSCVATYLLTSRQENEQWLCFAAPHDVAQAYLTHGITLSHTHPILLTTLSGMRAWLATLHEQEEPEQLEALSILRLYKNMVEDLLEPAPDETARFSCPFFWLRKK